MIDSKPTNQPPEKSKGVLILFAVLIGWTVLIAVGTLQTQASTDFRRPLIVIATMSVFLGGWAWAMIGRNRSSKTK